MAKRSTTADFIRREKRIQKMLADGFTKGQICEIVAEEEKIKPKTVEYQYYKIIKELEKLTQDGRSELRATLMARQEGIYLKAMANDNLKTALEATKAQAKLGGLEEAASTAQKTPDAIVFKERDFSKPLTVVPEKAENGE